MQAPRSSCALLVAGGRGQSPASRSRAGCPPSSYDEVAVDLGHDVAAGRPAGSPARRRCATVDAVEDSTPTAPWSATGRRATRRLPPGPRRRRRQPADHLELRAGRRRAGEEAVDRERERVGEQEQGAGSRRWSGQPTSAARPVSARPRGGRASAAWPGSRAAKTERAGESSISRPPPMTALAVPPRSTVGSRSRPDGGGDVLEGADVVGRGEQDHQVGALVAEAVEHLADRLADRLAGTGCSERPWAYTLTTLERTGRNYLAACDTGPGVTGRRRGAWSRCPTSRGSAARPATGPARSTWWPAGGTPRWLPRTWPGPRPSRPG